jgi:hypothetical protein
MKTSDAAKSLGIHPLNLVLKLQSLVGSPEECWPVVEEGFIETLEHLDQKTAFPKLHVEPRPVSAEETETERQLAVPQVSASAAKVVEKFCRKNYWGKKRVGWETMHNHLCRNINNLKEVVDELVKKGYLTPVRDGDAYSLNPGRTAEIEAIARRSIAPA